MQLKRTADGSKAIPEKVRFIFAPYLHLQFRNQFPSRKHAYIILTPYTPFYIVTLWFTGVYIIFSYFCSKT